MFSIRVSSPEIVKTFTNWTVCRHTLKVSILATIPWYPSTHPTALQDIPTNLFSPIISAIHNWVHFHTTSMSRDMQSYISNITIFTIEIWHEYGDYRNTEVWHMIWIEISLDEWRILRVSNTINILMVFQLIIQWMDQVWRLSNIKQIRRNQNLDLRRGY